jgi:hypothetical protein
MMRVIHRECALRHPFAVFVLERYLGHLDRTNFIAVAILQFATLFEHVLHKLVHEISIGRCMHPAGILIEALVHEELAPGHRAIGVKSLLADDMKLAAKEKRRVRIDEQHRIAGLLPSTGLEKSKEGSRLGTKLPWK